MEIEKFKLINDETVNSMKEISSNSIDCIFADPPYNMQTEGVLKRFEGTNFNGVNDEWDKFSSLNEYKKFTERWLIEAKRILKKDGTIWVIGSFQNIYIIGEIMQRLDFWILNDIVWNKTNPVPNFSGARFTNGHETLLWCSPKKGNKFTFNYKTMKYLNGGKQMKSVWNIPICSGSERLKKENGEKLHNTQKPIELLKRVLLSSTKEGDLILDPFNGTGTTGAVALKYKRRYIGIDLEIKYIKATEERLKNQKISREEKLIKNTYDIKPPLINVKVLIGQYIDKNAKLFRKEKDKYIEMPYKFTLEGKLRNIKNEEYSIHQAIKKSTGRPSENGWTQIYIYTNNEYKTLNYFRNKYRKEKLNFLNIGE